MGEDFNPEALRPAAYQPDAELTFSPKMLLGLFLGLVLLCGFCFVLGYSIGSRGFRGKAFLFQQPAVQAPPPSGFPAKPSAGPQVISRQSAAGALSASQNSSAVPAAGSLNPGAASVPGAESAQPAVRPALPATAIATTPVLGQPTPAFRSVPSGAWMVQIAIVSRQQDADILVAALRRQGYAVTARHDPADSMFHVQIGPFISSNDAYAARRRLLNDGYNAIVQP